MTGHKLIIFIEYVQHGGSLVIQDKDSQPVTGTVTETLENSKAILNSKRDIARLKTIIREGKSES